MQIDKREDLLSLLDDAENNQIISNLCDKRLRKISFKTCEGLPGHIEWYHNLCTLHFAGFSSWFDDVKISRTHPCYEKALQFSYNGIVTGFIGIKYSHLKEVTADDTN